MFRFLPLAVAAAMIASATVASAASHTPRRAADTSTTAPTTASNQFSTEGDAKSHCRGDTVVWVNTKTHVYHFAGNADYGHTKRGTFMCQADADRAGKFRAAKNEAGKNETPLMGSSSR